jgi:hypothetical protein|tara:strand:+ start:176 stop:1627 length:1452 start_codon:yes stop_codon:yes gene_type:complete
MDFNGVTPYDQLTEKWSPVLDHPEMPSIDDGYRKKVTAALLENQESALREERGNLHELAPVANSAQSAGLAGVNGEQRPLGGYDPILISLVRRAMPNLMAYDVAGVQPMSAPTGLIFALKSQFGDNRAATQGSDRLDEALFLEAGNQGGTAGATAANSFDPLLGFTAGDISQGRGMARLDAERLGDSTNNAFAEMAFSIERTSVTAKTRALKAEYTTELAQDLKAVHGLDAETELANILSTEILAEINREIIRTIYGVAKLGAQQKDLAHTGSTAVAINPNTKGGIYDLAADSDGRWSAERWRGLMFQIEREANVIAKQTRRGKGNVVICDSDTASALAMGGFLNVSPALNVNLDIDDTGNTFAGVLNGKFKVYIDPYASANSTSYSANVPTNYACVGYRGTNPYDAGLFYCPYVPLQMVRAVGENTFQPKIGFKTRYGLVSNPFVTTTGAVNGTPDGETLTVRANQYYRIFRVTNLHGNSGS